MFHRYTMAGVGAKVGAVALPYPPHPLVGGLGCCCRDKSLRPWLMSTDMW